MEIVYTPKGYRGFKSLLLRQKNLFGIVMISKRFFFSSGCFEDGQRVAVGKAFHVGGASIRYPGDPQAPGYLIYNCRCTLVSAVKGIDQSDAPRASKLGGVSYEDWKAGKEQENVEKSGKSGIIAIRNTIKSGEVSTRINPQKQNRHTKNSSGYIPGRSYIYGDLEDAQKLVDKLSCTGSPVMSKSGVWQNKKRIINDSAIGVYVNHTTKQEIETKKALIIYSSSGIHIVPRKV